jgi:hypothetical protein
MNWISFSFGNKNKNSCRSGYKKRCRRKIVSAVLLRFRLYREKGRWQNGTD